MSSPRCGPGPGVILAVFVRAESRRNGTRWRAGAGLVAQASRQDRDEPLTGTLLSGQAGLGLVGEWLAAGRRIVLRTTRRGVSRLSGQARRQDRGCSGAGQVAVDLPGNVALEDPDHLGLGAAFGQKVCTRLEHRKLQYRQPCTACIKASQGW